MSFPEFGPRPHRWPVNRSRDRGLWMTVTNDHDSDRAARSRAIPSDVKNALAYIRQGAGRQFSIADLAAHCGVSERTLHKHFRAFMGVSPLEFRRRLRLAEARNELLRCAEGTSVTDIATRFGFSHFGRFAQQYRRQFGETPSTTMRGSRLAQRAANASGRCNGGKSFPVKAALHRGRDKPSLAILPCEVAALAPEYRYFAEFLGQGIAAALSRVRSLSVVVPKQPHIGRHFDARRLARDVGARYLLIGSIAQSGARVRIMLRLIDAATASHVWGDVYDGNVANLFVLQDRTTEGAMRAILPQIRDAEIERARRKPPNELDAYGLTIRAFPFALASYPRAAIRALELLNRAMDIDPDYAPAAALAAWCHAQLVLHNGAPSLSEERGRALLLSERAGLLDPDDALVLTARCAVHTMAGQFDHAGALIARALCLDPSFVWGWERSGWLNAFKGEPDTAIAHFERANRLDIRGANPNRMIGIGCAHFDAGRYDQAAFYKRRALREQPGTAWINRTLSVSYARLGEMLAALDAIEALHRYSPDLTISKIVSALPFRQDFLDRVAEGLDELGLSV
jgi:TolB-like protein/AraC-like DNA-binding protein